MKKMKRKIFINGIDLLGAKIKKEGEFKGCLFVEAHDMDPSGESILRSYVTCYFENIYDDEYELMYVIDNNKGIDYIEDELNDIELLIPQGGFGQVVTIKKIERPDLKCDTYIFEGKSYLPNRASCIYRSKKGILYYVFNSFGCYSVRNTDISKFAKSAKVTKEIKENVILI